MPPPDEALDGAAVRVPPPLVPLLALGIGIALQLAVWPIPSPVEGLARYASGTLLILAGVGLLVAAMRPFQETGQDPKPWESTPEIISTGIYRFTRNPMYLGMGLLQAGIGLSLANPWVVGLVPISWLIIYTVAIRHEEAYLEAKFGSAYTDYKRSVRRWL
ncbi:MAG: isoprenylcysteine carboxylmethyltransferase family protein [Deltaproteobacteria bacterium]|jgi:protein-S-isoprenylcysteine O-methyltransferase Ste14|nr:isoprenylcysteine carboxylmethyltransferase family protein [Deltaproteobacteria bacterium]